jgi:NADH-quinone oxidoreductase subunit C
MSARLNQVESRLRELLDERLTACSSAHGELTIEVRPEDLLHTCRLLRDEEGLAFETLVDLCGVDYLSFGQDEWKTADATSTGFSRSVRRGPVEPGEAPRRYAVVYHLLSVSLNQRLRLKVFAESADAPIIDSVIDIWPSANWYEREAFDLFGILFDGHPDLRRLLTDYGFIGHPFRKDFPVSGNVEVRYDSEKGRVVYEPVEIEPRTLVPRVIRSDNRYAVQRPDGNAVEESKDG